MDSRERGRPEGSPGRKIFCNVVEGVTYESRCLYKLSKIIEGNRICENCILRELEKLKSCRAEEVKEKPGQMMKPKKKPGGMRKVRGHIKTCEDTKIIKDTSNVFITKDMKTSEKMNQSEDTRQSYTVRLLANLLGKSERTLQEWAEKGKIPAVRVGVKWCFPKEEIDRLLLKGKDGTPEPPQLEEKEKPPEIQKTDFSPENQGEPEKGV